eukprot:7717292-Alexandrium_andersonii.AAC.1
MTAGARVHIDRRMGWPAEGGPATCKHPAPREQFGSLPPGQGQQEQTMHPGHIATRLLVNGKLRIGLQLSFSQRACVMP